MTTTLKERHDLYTEYMYELSKFFTKSVTPEEIEYGFNQQNNSPDIIWNDIFYEKKRVGFVILGINEMCHPDADYFIVNTFVKQQYRRKHLASDTVTRFLQERPGKYCLDIITRNFTAEQFWENTFHKNRYVPIYLRHIPHNTEPGVLTYAWEPKGDDT